MKLFRYILIGLLLTLQVACSNDEFELAEPNVQREAAVELAISLDKVGNIDMNSRAGDDDKFSVINDVNIRVDFNNGSSEYVYVYKNNQGNFVLDSNSKHFIVAEKTSKQTAYVHLDSKKGVTATKVQVIGNHGKAITAEEGWNQVMKTTISWPASFDDSKTCYLYGEATEGKLHETPHENAQGGSKGCYLFNVPLKRPFAMVKVNVNTTELEKGVTITPKYVQLYNVPKTCTLAPTNQLAGFSSFDKLGQSYTFQSGETASGSLYLFENMQNDLAQNCKDEKSANEKAKTPNSGDATAESVYKAFTDYTNQSNLGIRCSYVLLEADYEYQTNDAHVKGTIRYRFFLGKHIAYNFDVERNTIYNLTLNLTKTGGIKESGAMDADGTLNVSGNIKHAQWRVDTELSDIFIHFDEGHDFNIDGHLMIIDIVADKNKKWEIEVRDASNKFNTTSWAKVLVVDQYGIQNQITPKYGGQSYEVVTGDGNQEGMQVYLAGFTVQNDWKNQWNSKTPYDSVFFCIREKNKAETEVKYVLRRWYPIKISTLGNNFYVDRVDRSAKEGSPWGDDSFKTSKTDGWNILFDYWASAKNKKYDPTYRNGSVMEQAIYISANASGSSSEQGKQDGWLSFNHYYLPTVDEWKKINEFLAKGVDDKGKPINYNFWKSVPYWTSTTGTTGGKPATATYTPGSGVSSFEARDTKHPFRMLRDDGKTYVK